MTATDTKFFSFEEPKEKIPEGNYKMTPCEVALMADKDKWKNYTNEYLYDVEVRLRKFMAEMAETPGWSNQVWRRKFTCAMLVEILYGRPYDVKIDSKYIRVYSKIFSYYSSRIQKNAYIRAKKKTVNKSVYTLSPKRADQPPFSLKLRYEWLMEQGIEPTYQNLRLSKDSLSPGHARNPRTEENMRLRREKARQLYNERYSNRAH